MDTPIVPPFRCLYAFSIDAIGPAQPLLTLLFRSIRMRRASDMWFLWDIRGGLHMAKKRHACPRCDGLMVATYSDVASPDRTGADVFGWRA